MNQVAFEFDLALMAQVFGFDISALKRIGAVKQYMILLHIRKLEQALEDLANGEYGICQCCGEDIAIKRLKAIR